MSHKPRCRARDCRRPRVIIILLNRRPRLLVGLCRKHVGDVLEGRHLDVKPNRPPS